MRNKDEAHSPVEQLSHELALRFARKVSGGLFRAVENIYLTAT